MRRFFIEPDTISGDSILVTGTEARHIHTVLRLQPGQTVQFFDLTGKLYQAILEECTPGRLSARITDTVQTRVVETSPLTLAQALLKGKKMDLLIQKATELGVHRFIPVRTSYSEPKTRRPRQTERWQRIMIEACKQCRRTLPMLIDPVIELDGLRLDGYTHRLVAWEQEQVRAIPVDVTTCPGPTWLLIGPEGGLRRSEIDALQLQDVKVFSMGSRILRAETATLAAVSIFQYLAGNLSQGER